ncbi:TPA: hypothetical protein CPT80_05925 [Candidatus Gastranaerophilales bacterium HUM_9]|nr:MAG TPA: hypothetical protein CPT80_05925 [Candidatus Gastranaerophilales bacterium HUM_9]HBX34413.1 hypothetical protein [Cyanobacteria bacterium UBA11440]
MTTPISTGFNNSAQNYAGIGIYCNVIDPSKLPPDHPLLKGNMPNCTVVGPGGSQPNYGPGYYVNNYANNVTKKRVTILTDEYLQKLDKMLDGNDTTLREYAASEVVKRFQEDKTRMDDKALNALVNKMLLDPYDHKVRGRGLMLLDTNLASGDDNTMAVLDKISQDPNLQDSDKGKIETCKLQLSAKTTLVNTPVSTPASLGGDV